MPTLSSEQIRHVCDAQRALLSLDAARTLDTWAEPAFGPLRRLLKTDHVYMVAPRVAPCGTPLDDLVVHSPSAGDGFARAIVREFVGFDGGFTQFREGYATFQHRLVRAAGAGAYHDGPMYDRGTREAMDLYGEAFRPARIERQMALSVPLPRGEAMVVFGFGHDDVPDVDGARHQALKLLLPAFEAGLHLRLRTTAARHRGAATLDASGVAAVAFDVGGRERHRTPALARLLAASPAAEAVAASARALAAGLLGPEGSGATSVVVRAGGADYALRGGYDDSVLGAPGVVVSVERTSVLPPHAALGARFGLTPREAEVAVLMARGHADKEVAEALFISPGTARRHAERVLKKVGVSSRAALAYTFLRRR